MAYIKQDYVIRFTQEWNQAVWRLLRSGYDLSKIPLAPLPTERKPEPEEPFERVERADEYER